MRSMHASLLVLLTGLSLAADKPKDGATKKDMEKLTGTWKVVSAERDGQPDKTLKDAVTTYTADGKFTVKHADGKGGEGTYKLDLDKRPKAIDYTTSFGPEKGKVHQGIYALEGDTLTIRGSDPGKERPEGFAAKTNAAEVLLVLRREKMQIAKGPPPPPVFSDKNLEALVRQALQEPKGELNDTNLLNVYILEDGTKGKNIGKHVSNLKGLEKCKNLALLELTNNTVSDLAPLKDLTNLQSLDLAGNKITDVAPLAGLTRLQRLELSNNQISNLAPLSGLSNLTSLYLTGNKITDINPLGNLSKLSSLSLGHNRITDISALAKVSKINSLELKDNEISDISPLAKQTELRLLMLDRNKISDLAPLVTAAKADSEGQKRFAPYLELYLDGNPLSDAVKANQVAALKGFGVRLQQ